MAGAMTAVDYISDDGHTYGMRQDFSNAAVLSNPSLGADRAYLPKNYRPRYILAKNPTDGRQRKLVVSDPASDFWTGATNTVSLPDFDATPDSAVVHNITGRVGEKRYRGLHT